MNVVLVILFHIVLTQTETRVLENRTLSWNRRFPEADWRVLNSFRVRTTISNTEAEFGLRSRVLMVFDYTETTMTIREQLTVNFECPLLTLKEQASEIKYLSISSSNMLTSENFGLPKTKISCTSATIQTRKFKFTFLQTNISRKLIFKNLFTRCHCAGGFFFYFRVFLTLAL